MITTKKLLVLALSLLTGTWAWAQEEPLIKKDKDIPANVIRATREFRERMLTDPHRPAFHFAFPEGNGVPGDPNGAFYHNGLYHLMFLYRRTDGSFAWGHSSSKDLLHWRYHPDAIGPGEGDEGCFSGGAFVDDDGSAVLSYWMLWGAKGIGLAKSNDPGFSSWKKFPANPVIKSTDWGITAMKDKDGKPFYVGSADPSNIWKKDGKYYMLTGNLLVLRKYGSRGKGLPSNTNEGTLPADSVDYQGDRLYLFESPNLTDWTYKHEFYKADRKWTEKTEDNMCPSFLPLPSSPNGGRSDKHLLLFISHNLGCQYYVGDYKNDKFFPSTHGRMTWKDNAYFAPEALVDDKGRQIMWAWIFDDRPDSLKNHYGWNGIYGIPRSLWVQKDGTLGMRPVEEMKALRNNEKERKNISLSGTNTLFEKANDLLEMEITIQPGAAKQTGVVIGRSADGKEETVIYYDAEEKKLKVDATRSSLSYGRRTIESAPFELKKGENLVLNIFVDKGIVEVFANDRQAIARTIYPTLGGTGVQLFSKGGASKVITVKSWDLVPSNPF